MLSAVLRSDVAIQVSIRIIKTFVEMRKYLAGNSMLLEKVGHIEKRQIQAEIRQEDFEKLTAQDIANFNTQYPTLDVKRTTAFHDRFLIIDGNIGYHMGASIKDAGKKCFGINRIEDVSVINDLVSRVKITS